MFVVPFFIFVRSALSGKPGNHFPLIDLLQRDAAALVKPRFSTMAVKYSMV